MKHRSPFPGMDPFLEQPEQWQLFHPWFIRELARQTQDLARARGFNIDVERNVYQREPTGELTLIGEPDALTWNDTIDESWRESGGGAAVAVAEPTAIHEVVLDPDEMETYKQDYLVVRKNGRPRTVVAVVELLSPSNKKGQYALKYREKRSRFLTSHVHFLEIDFLRGGTNPSREMFPELPSTPYFLFLARKTGIGRNEEGYPLRLQDKLPVIGLPVGYGQPDLPLDLPAAFEAAYDLSVHSGDVDYSDDPVPEPPLSDDDANWVLALLTAQSKRTES